MHAFPSLLCFLNCYSSFHSQIMRESTPPPPTSCLGQSSQLKMSIGQCPFLGRRVPVTIQWMSFSLSMLLSTVGLSVCLSLPSPPTHHCTMPVLPAPTSGSSRTGMVAPSLHHFYFHCPLLNACFLWLHTVTFNFSVIRKAETCHYILSTGINRYTTFMVWGTF